MEGLGHVHHHPPAAPDDPGVLREQRARVAEVLEQTLVEHHVEGAVAERQGQGVGAHQMHRGPGSARLASHQLQRRRRVVDHHRRGARAGEAEAVAPRARADLEHAPALDRALAQDLPLQPPAGRVGAVQVLVPAPVRLPVLERGAASRLHGAHSPHWSRSARNRGRPAAAMRFIAPSTG